MSQWGEVLAAAELDYIDRMRRLAGDRFTDMQRDAQNRLADWDEYDETGIHPGFHGKLSTHPNAHSPEFTSHWAAEELNGHGGSQLQQLSREYGNALGKVATEGPLGLNDQGIPHHQALETAHNNLRVELQHGPGKRFVVPFVSKLSSVNHHGEAHADGALVNPRHDIGTGENSLAGEEAYRINCQRCVLAADARYRGFNVEAQSSYQSPRGGPVNDDVLDDHDIAGLWRNPNGSTPRWQDMEDIFPHIPLRGPGLWDSMTQHIATTWPAGGRGTVAMYYKTQDGGIGGHVIIAKNDLATGQVRYEDPQKHLPDVGDRWRKAFLNHAAPEANTRREVRARAWRWGPGEEATKIINKHSSALRLLRFDHLELHPRSARYMVDRGTAPDRPILPPTSTT